MQVGWVMNTRFKVSEDIYRKIKTPKKLNIPMVNIKYFQLEYWQSNEQESLYLAPAAVHRELQVRLLITKHSYIGVVWGKDDPVRQAMEPKQHIPVLGIIIKIKHIIIEQSRIQQRLLEIVQELTT